MCEAGLFDLEKHFAFYGAYHKNPINVLIHTLFVWPIVFFTLVILHFVPPLLNLSHIGFIPSGFLDDRGLVLNLGFFLTIVYALFYICLDKKAGSLAALLCLACWVGGSSLAARLGFSLAWKVVLAAQLFCWTGQFLGHGLFEKRAPALLDNLVQAFVMAPLFVLLEVLQTCCGYEPYPGFHASVKAKIEAELKELEDRKQKKIS
ncbi:2-hydroxy-palmitic acid dioxygenase mpo1-like [Tripterygium wilfordii]|uniref:2-hydroxy-palmitic acid dioxygenase mpo1-like n=1 Tax=Tripterygium wilfordii TaxID=458696 RepID=UPI0018F85720|nr:2-hydroxy-palmitic acid dioxygenase mpo1-like [Tripterygium wilfordii]